jgi:hypothetical protein
MARLGCIVKALMVVGSLTGSANLLRGAAEAQTPAQPAPPAVPPTAAPPALPEPPAVAPVPEAAPPASAAPSGEPVFAGEVSAPVVQSPGPIPAPPPDRYAFPATRPVEACPPGRCGHDCQLRCRGHRTCLSDGSCDKGPEDLGQEHKGLLLRATTGWGFGRLSASQTSQHESSFVLGFGVDVGAAVVENLIVRGRVRGSAGYYRESDFGDEVLFTFGGVGAGVDYYFMPVNLYVGGTISVAGIARAQADEDKGHRSKAGVGLDLDVGKEWWVGKRWGLGLSLRASYVDVASANIVNNPSARLRAFHIGLQLSATFN